MLRSRNPALTSIRVSRKKSRPAANPTRVSDSSVMGSEPGSMSRPTLSTNRYSSRWMRGSAILALKRTLKSKSFSLLRPPARMWLTSRKREALYS